MPSDLTRSSHDDLRQRYKAVVMQQGRVTLDRDFNALQEIVNGQIAADALDVIGPCGTPDDGFAISLAETGPSLSYSSNFSAPQADDFLIAPGTMYVGGQRVVLPPPGPNQAPWSYFHQPDWIAPATPAAFQLGSFSTPLSEYVYLHVYEQEVGAVEDSDLLDVALGGPDTTQRVRLMWRVVRMPVDATDCATALALAQTEWAAKGFLFDKSTMRLLPQAALQVSFAATPAASNLCDPVAEGGYLGAENQLIRLQISERGSTAGPQLLWGYDDASFIYRVSPQSDGMSLLLNEVPVDAFHCPASTQVVEVLRTAAILGVEPDATDPTGTSTIVRCVAEATGYVTTVASYTNSDNKVTLNSSLPAAYLNDVNPLFLRIWQGQQTIDLSSQPMNLTDPTTQTSLGIQVTLTVPSGGSPAAAVPDGTFWMIAARPSTPQAVYPERFLSGPQAPDGPRQWICPLAVIDWAQGDFASVPSSSGPAATIVSCRQQFCNLVSLSKRRQGGCCSVSVAPSDSPNLQAILDKAASSGQNVTICFSAGTYSLVQPLRLSSQHSGFILEACGGGVTLEASPNSDMTPFLDGLLVLVLANDVTIKNLTVLAPSAPLERALEALGQADSLATITSSPGSLQSIVGIRLFQCLRVNIEGCSIRLTPQTQFTTIGAGVYLSGDCTGLSIRNCHFASATPSTVTLPTTTDSTLKLNLSAGQEPLVESTPAPRTAASKHRALRAKTPTPTPTPAASQSGSTTSLVPVDLSTRLKALAEVASPPLDATAQGLVALFGVFACTVTETIAFGGKEIGSFLDRLPTLLDHGRLSDNDFYNLTLAVWYNATIGTYRAQNNRVTSCFGGLWLETSDFVDPADNNNQEYTTQWTNFYNQTHEFQEISLLGGQALPLLPLPTGLTLAEFATLYKERPAAPPTSLTISSNHVDTSIVSPSVNGGTGIMLLLNRNPVSGQDTTSSLVMDSNQVRGQPAQSEIPVVLIATGGATAVTGNLIDHTGTRNEKLLSLWLFPTAGLSSVPQLAVTGNVLAGRSNLPQLTRSEGGTAPFNTWTPFNSSNA